MPGVVQTHPETGVFRVRFDYDPDMVKAVKIIPGAKYQGNPSREWWVPPSSADELAAFVDRWNMRCPPATQDRIRFAREKVQDAILLSQAVDDKLCADLLTDFPLLPYQRAGVAYALQARRTWIADDMGLGKTLQAIAAVHAAQATPALVICPALLKVNWKREIERWLDNPTVEILYGKTPVMLDPSADFTIVNYDIVMHHEDFLKDRKYASVIVDESQYIRNRNERSRAVKRMTRNTRKSHADPLILELTGTPWWLGTKDLVNQLEAMGRMEDMGGWPLFKARYLDSDENDLELHERLRGKCMIRRKKADVLKELPPKRRAPLVLEPDPKVKREYDKAEADIVRYVEKRAEEIAIEIGDPNPRSAAVLAKLKAESAKHLVRISALRKLAARAKIPALKEWVREFLKGGNKLVVFAHHVEIIEALRDEFKAVTVMGDQSTQARQAAVDAFQDDPDEKVIVVGITAGGVGITLTAAQDVLFVEMGWTPGGQDQCEDRLHRIGQAGSVTAWYSLAVDTIDEWLYQLLADRREQMERVTDGEQAEQLGKQSMGADVIDRLMRGPTAPPVASDPNPLVGVNADGMPLTLEEAS